MADIFVSVLVLLVVGFGLGVVEVGNCGLGERENICRSQAME
jgi:hypothetical protein